MDSTIAKWHDYGDDWLERANRGDKACQKQVEVFLNEFAKRAQHSFWNGKYRILVKDIERKKTW